MLIRNLSAASYATNSWCSNRAYGGHGVALITFEGDKLQAYKTTCWNNYFQKYFVNKLRCKYCPNFGISCIQFSYKSYPKIKTLSTSTENKWTSLI